MIFYILAMKKVFSILAMLYVVSAACANTINDDVRKW